MKVLIERYVDFGFLSNSEIARGVTGLHLLIRAHDASATVVHFPIIAIPYTNHYCIEVHSDKNCARSISVALSDVLSEDGCAFITSLVEGSQIDTKVVKKQWTRPLLYEHAFQQVVRLHEQERAVPVG